MAKMIQKVTVMEDDHDDKRSEVSDMEETGTRSESGNSCEENENIYFAKAESRTVQNLKLVVLSILLCVTIAVCFAVYHITSKGQHAEFEGR